MGQDHTRIGTAFVTGGAGFIGSYIRDALLRCDVQVHSLDTAAHSAPPRPGERFVRGDLVDTAVVLAACAGADTVVHLAAKHRFFGVSEDEFWRVNVEGTRTVLDAARECGVRRVIHFSSVAVYGDSAEPTSESIPCAPTTPYGRSKLESERLVREWSGEAPSRAAIIIRPTVVFGPGNRGNIYRLIRQVDRRLFLPVGRGDNLKSVAYVENLVAATTFLMSRMTHGCEIFNYADEPHLSFRQITNLIYIGLGKRPVPVRLPLRPMLIGATVVERVARIVGADLPITAALRKMNKVTHHDARKVRQFGFQAPVPLEEGFARTLKAYVAQKG